MTEEERHRLQQQPHECRHFRRGYSGLLSMKGLFAFLLIAVGGFAYSQSAHKDKPVEAASAYQIRSGDQRETRINPLVIAATVAEPDEIKASAEREKNEKSLYERLIAYSTVALGVATFCLVAVTAILAYYTYGLYKETKTLREGADAVSAKQAADMAASIAEATRAASAMEELADATRRNAGLMQAVMQRQMRAYISVDLGGATYQEKNLRFASHPVLANTGFTPARKVSYWATADVLPTELSKDFEFPVGSALVTDVGMSPRQSYVIHGVDNKYYPDPEVAEILKGDEKRLFVWGLVTYEDIFGDKWETRFCHSFNFFLNEKGDLVPNGVYHPTHNHAT